MKFIANISMCDPTFYVPLAQAAEAAGFDTIAVPDCIAYPKESSSTYPYNFDGTREFLENKPFIEPIVAIAAMAAVDVDHRVPHLRAQDADPPPGASTRRRRRRWRCSAATGSCSGVGTSPWPDDYEIVQLPWEGRGRRFDECIEIVRGLAAGGYFEYHGEFYDFPAIKMEPVPTRADPGAHRRARRRATATRRAPRRRLDGRRRHARRPDPDDRPHERPAQGVRPRRRARSTSTPRRPSRSPSTASSSSRTSASRTPRAASAGSTPTGSRPTPRRSRRRSTTSTATATRSSASSADGRGQGLTVRAFVLTGIRQIVSSGGAGCLHG